MPILKICGNKQTQNMQAVAALQPDWMGFIFYQPSPRFVGYDFVMPSFPSIKNVAVFVNASLDEIHAVTKNNKVDLIQLHGNESPDFCAALKPYPVIKAFHVDDAFSFNNTKPYESVCAYFLFDTKTALFGGSGKKFDWTTLSSYHGKTPFLLSGGITPEDGEAIKKIKNVPLFGIDLNSGVEHSPGIKDVEKIRAFQRALNE